MAFVEGEPDCGQESHGNISFYPRLNPMTGKFNLVCLSSQGLIQNKASRFGTSTPLPNFFIEFSMRLGVRSRLKPNDTVRISEDCRLPENNDNWLVRTIIDDETWRIRSTDSVPDVPL